MSPNEVWTVTVPGIRALTVTRDDEGWWYCQNHYETTATSPGHGARLLIGWRNGWVVGWEVDVLPQREGVPDLQEALNFLVAPAEPNRPWMDGLAKLVEDKTRRD